MKAETIRSGHKPFGISLTPETDDDKEILKKFFYSGVRTTAYSTTNQHLILEGPLERRQTDTENHISRCQLRYKEYMDRLLERGYHRQLITIDQNSEDFVTVYGVSKGNSSKIASIRCPNGKIMSIMGIEQVPQGEDFLDTDLDNLDNLDTDLDNLDTHSDLAYPFGLKIIDKDGKEIPDDTKIRIVKDEPSVTLLQLEKLSYSDIKMKNGEAMHRLKKNVEFRGGEYLIIHIINFQSDIRSENIQLKMKADIWSRDT
jgi:hypothetical protein